MTIRTFTKEKKGRKEEWSFEETPEFKAALATYWATVAEYKAKGVL